MFNHLRAKMVALAAFAASLVRASDPPSGPVFTEHKLPGLPRKVYHQRRRSRSSKSRARCGHEIADGMYYNSKLGKRFAEAAYRGPRGY